MITILTGPSGAGKTRWRTTVMPNTPYLDAGEMREEAARSGIDLWYDQIIFRMMSWATRNEHNGNDCVLELWALPGSPSSKLLLSYLKKLRIQHEFLFFVAEPFVLAIRIRESDDPQWLIEKKLDLIEKYEQAIVDLLP